MKKILLSVAMLASALTLVSCFAPKNQIKVISYNIRLSAHGGARGADGIHYWDNRRHASINMINDEKPTVFGLQEACSDQIDFLEENLPQYDYIGVGRDDGKRKGEFMSIFYKKEEVEFIDGGTFWLSETPQKPSKGWDAACFRTATWALMKDKKTGKKFYFVNTHLDHEGKEAQKNGLKLIVDRIGEINPEGYPMVLTGDFNMKPDDPNLAELDSKMQSTRKIAAVTDNHDTYNGWGRGSGIIDYIYVSGFSSCPEYQTVVKRYRDRKFVSDHYPVSARLIF